MTSQLIEEVRKWDSELKERKILLVINLQNIVLAFLLPDTSVLQPMDQKRDQKPQGTLQS